jgi:hypothetical protein
MYGEQLAYQFVFLMVKNTISSSIIFTSFMFVFQGTREEEEEWRWVSKTMWTF